MTVMAVEPIPIEQRIELAEAVIELAMARHASIEPRGFDSRRMREKLHAHIDSMLDELAWLKIQRLILETGGGIDAPHTDSPAPETT